MGRECVGTYAETAFLQQLFHKEGGLGHQVIQSELRLLVNCENATGCEGRAKGCEKLNFSYGKAEVFQLNGMY